MILKFNILYTLLCIGFVINTSDHQKKNENISEEFTGKSPVIFGHSNYITPGSHAAKAIERDSVQRRNVLSVSAVHGCILSEKK